MNFLGLHAALTGFQACNPRNCPTHTEVLGSFIAHLMFTPKGELHIYREIGSTGCPVNRLEAT